MNKYIINISTGTFINVNECVVVDLDSLDAHDTELFNAGWEDEIIDVAMKNGKPLQLQGDPTPNPFDFVWIQGDVK